MPLSSVDRGDAACTWPLCVFAAPRSITAERAGARLMVLYKGGLEPFEHVCCRAEWMCTETCRGDALEMVETAQRSSTDALARALLQDYSR